MNNEKIKINIYGGGISGLVTAFELSKYSNFIINIYEKSNILGGMAKSKYINNIPSEHSWRGYAPFYHNTFDILKQINVDYVCNKIVGGNKKYTIKDIENSDKLLCYYKNNVYDLTEYVSEHPGGNIILNAKGKNLETIWSDYGYEWHNNNNKVISLLEKYKIGVLNNQENFSNQNTAYDNLKKIDFKLLFNSKKRRNYAKLENLPFLDLIYLGYYFLKSELVNKRKSKYFNMKFKNILDNTSEKSKYYFGYYISGPGAGFDLNTISYMSFAKFIMLNLYENMDYWYVMNKPTNEAWIDPLIKILKSKNVNIMNDSILSKINYNDDVIHNCIINDKKVYADIHIFGLDPFNFENVLNNSNIVNNYYKLNTINNQISFRLGFTKKIKFNKNNKKSTGFVLMDSPFNITFYCQSDDWCENIKYENNIQTLISGTIIMPYNNGILYNKSATSHNIEELQKEIIEQFYTSFDFINQINKYNDFTITRDDFTYVEIYDDYYFDEKTKMLKTKNKKWVNNFLNDKYRPKYKTQFNNGYVVGSHCKTTVDVWSMEGACESAKKVSNLIFKKYNKPLCYIYNHNSSNIIFDILRNIDDVLFKLKLFNVLDLIVIIIILLLVFNLT